MKTHHIVWLYLVSQVVPLAVYGQALMENSSMQAGASGLGAGLSASFGHGQVLQRSLNSMTQVQQAALQQTQAIEQYFNAGCQYEAKKQWTNAERAFQYVLQVMALRDGAGNINSVPVLKHLVNTSKQEKNLDKAITYQKAIVTCTKSARLHDANTVVKSQADLWSLYLQKHDYKNAEPVLHDSVTIYNQNPSLPAGDRTVTLRTYGKVLRQLNKTAEAEKIEKEAAPAPQGTSAPEHKQEGVQKQVRTVPAAGSSTTTSTTTAPAAGSSTTTSTTTAPAAGSSTTTSTTTAPAAGSSTTTSTTTAPAAGSSTTKHAPPSAKSSARKVNKKATTSTKHNHIKSTSKKTRHSKPNKKNPKPKTGKN